MIPKIIHQTWISQDLIPKAYKECVDSVKSKNADYEYRFYDDNDCVVFIENKFPEFLNVYKFLTPVEKADLFRYLIVYEYGGVYLDIDCYCVENFDSLIKDAEFVVGCESGFQVNSVFKITQWAFASKAKHPILIEVAKQCEKNHLRNSTMFTLKKTGPLMWTNVINKLKDTYKIRLGGESWFASRIKGVNCNKIIPKWNARRNVNQDKEIKDKIYIIHLCYSSWNTRKKKNHEQTMSIHAIKSFMNDKN
tara:strand:- start:5201 stop:5950 length:750 start_codon:yes stop_codon:yes gene_type:complete